MKIAICDDNLEDIKELKGFILESEFCPEDIVLYEYLSGEELLNNFTKFDLIFLDLKLNRLNGIQIAEAIHLQDSQVPISFYTGYDVGASQIVKLRPFSYLVKGRDDIKAIVDKTLKDISSRQKQPSLFVTYDGKMFILQLSDILYISILDKGTEICLTDEKTNEIFGDVGKNTDPLERTIKSGVKLETYYEQLKDYDFMYAKKSYIINAQYVMARLKDSVLLKGHHELSVARSRKKEFDDQLFAYWVRNAIGRKNDDGHITDYV